MTRMTRLMAALAALWLALMLTWASPRNVGDSSEYLGMALNLARFAPPSLHADQLRAVTATYAHTPPGFELETRRLPELKGRDGRYDMPHLWMYALLAVPGVWVAWLAGAPPEWGFVALNTALLGTMLALALRRGAGPWTMVLAASPLVWWLDKPLADLLIAAMLGVAVLCWPRHGAVSLVALGLATAQNPALVVPCVVFGVAALAGDRARLRDRRWWAGALAGAGLAAVGPAYSLWRLDRLSPLTSYTAAWWPTMTSLLFPLADVNMGAVPRFPPGAIAVGLALLRPAGWKAPAALPAAVSAAALLVVFSQQPNMNQGGNPDFSRYAVWLLPLALPWLLDADRAPRLATRATGLLLLAACAVWTLAAFRPSRPESYRYPTALASWLWTTHPSWTQPRPEAFAERTSHREPAIVPTATPGCEKVLLHEGAWPAPCPPAYAEVPTACHEANVACYADAGPLEGMHTVSYAGVVPGWHFVVHDRTWRSGDPAASWVASHAAGLRAGSAPDPSMSVRAAWDVEWTYEWSDAEGRRLLVYVRGAAQGARLAVRHRGTLHVTVTTPDGQREARRFGPGDSPTTVSLPIGPHVLVEMRVG